jgi:predicted PurR-regulated permease PerM
LIQPLSSLTNSLVVLVIITALALVFLVIIPITTSSLFDLNPKCKETLKELQNVLEKFSPESLNKKPIYLFLGIEFDDPARLIDIFSKLMGILFTFVGIAWSIYTWKQSRNYPGHTVNPKSQE